jgi:CRISPR/Cas system endoribonuclease Cas6 (RAMP superfamily)
MRLKLSGSNNLVQQANLLLAFGNYSGVGIKTCLGMGGMEVEF